MIWELQSQAYRIVILILMRSVIVIILEDDEKDGHSNTPDLKENIGVNHTATLIYCFSLTFVGQVAPVCGAQILSYGSLPSVLVRRGNGRNKVLQSAISRNPRWAKFYFGRSCC